VNYRSVSFFDDEEPANQSMVCVEGEGMKVQRVGLDRYWGQGEGEGEGEG